MFDVSAVTGLAGVSLRDVSITARLGGETASRRGDMLFTHRGISGPACLSLSRTVAELLDRVGSSVSITADLFPDLDEQMISEILVGYAGRYGSQLVRTFVRNRPMSRNSPVRDAGAPQESCRVPNAFLPAVMKQAGIAFDLPLSGLTRNRRFSLVSALKKMPLGMAAHVPLEQAEVSAGGVSLHDVVPSSMESRLHPNLFFCGEVLDYAGEVGGFNLQAAFSTGWVAGTQAVSRIAAGILRHA
jgi:predicted Rossmann fold flavoprotein